MSSSKRPKRDKALIAYEVMGLIGAAIGALLAIEKTVVIHASSCGSTVLNPKSIHPVHHTVIHTSNICFGQPFINDFVQYGVPAIIGLFAGFLVALMILVLHRVFTGLAVDKAAPPEAPPEAPLRESADEW